MVLVRRLAATGRKEGVPGHPAHGGEHALVPHIAGLELQPHHPIRSAVLLSWSRHGGTRCQKATRTGSSLLRMRWEAVEPSR
jgi:hypothetical protein